jgi:stage II sporulation protein D
MQRWARHSALAALAAGAAATSCRGALTRQPRDEPAPVRAAIDTVRLDTVVGDTAFPMMPAPIRRAPNRGPLVRIVLASRTPLARLSATGRWTIVDLDGVNVAAGDPSDRWTASVRSGRIRLERTTDGRAISVQGPVSLRPIGEDGFVSLGARRYRGELLLHAEEHGVTIVNRLPAEDYLLGVVPLEIGERTVVERAAVEAQAIAARSYTHTHRGSNARWDMRATVDDQVYGGVDVERPFASAAVEATAGQVLTYGGRIADAPYHSTCGGSTAEAPEVWTAETGAPYLRRVSDRVPGTDRYYCDAAPRFSWEREIAGDSVGVLVARYLQSRGRTTAVGRVRGVRIATRTPSGRVGTLAVEGSQGDAVLRGNEIRFAFRSSGGELLNSTYFSVEVERGGAAGIQRLVLRGHGYGHGIGMCQWGAIGRARAGQDAPTILRTYYPGTSVAIVR